MWPPDLVGLTNMAVSVSDSWAIASTFTTQSCHYNNFLAHRQVVDFIEYATKNPGERGIWRRTREVEADRGRAR